MTAHGHQQTAHSYGFYVFIWVGLLVLTGFTVAVAGVSLKELSAITALVIASVKSYSVVAYFMHLKDDDRMFKLMFIFLILVIAVILILTFCDVLYR